MAAKMSAPVTKKTTIRAYLLLSYFVCSTIGTSLLPLEVFEIPSAAAVQAHSTTNNINSSNISNSNHILIKNSNNTSNDNNSTLNSINHTNLINNSIHNINMNSKNISYINSNNINLLKSILNNINKANANSNSNSNLNNNSFKDNLLPFLSNQIKLENTNRRSSRQMTPLMQQKLLNDEMLMPHRILYQLGESEEDLPICASNAVCSKIDVYDIPWIERQCRCPSIAANRIKIHHHHNHNHQHHVSNHNLLAALKHNQASSNQLPQSNLKQRQLYDIKGRKMDDIEIRKFMQKLQAVYRDDLALSENDLRSADEIQTNKLSLLPTPEQQQQQPQQNIILFRKVYRQVPQADAAALNYNGKLKVGRESNKLRHSGHLGQHHHQSHHNRRQISFLSGCPNDIRTDDGYTISDKTRHYKLCSPVHKLPLCNSFTDFTWTVTTMPDQNITEQIVHCRCRPNSVTYLTKWEPNLNSGYTYYFACSPQNRLRCQRKEPCRLFTVRQRQEHFDEVNTNPLCQCPRDHKCPTHHTDSGVVAGESFADDNIKTYAGYCMAND